MSICIECGICCDGTMFGQVGLDASESTDALVEAGITVVLGTKQKPSFSQPCAAFDRQCCTIYPQRPETCRTFRCRLLEANQAGDVEEQDARQVIERAKELRDVVRPQLEMLGQSSTPQTLGDLYHALGTTIQKSPDRVKAQRDHAELLFDVVALRRLLKEHFEKARTSENLPSAWPTDDFSLTE